MPETRDTLKTYFEAGDRPTEQQFADLIDSTINIADDGISSTENTLHVQKDINVAGTIDVDNYIRHNGDDGTRIGFPADDTIQLRTNGTPRLTVDSDGHVGIGTADPEAPLHIRGSAPVDLTGASGHIIIGDSDAPHIAMDNNGIQAKGDDITPVDLGLQALGGSVGIGTASPGATLDVAGNLAISGNEVINSAGEWVGPSFQVPQGGIIMWSGTVNEIPGGWALCDGQDGRPDLRGRFIVGAAGPFPDPPGPPEGHYNVDDVGGSNEVTLTTVQMPSHSHGIHNGGEHFHNFSVYGANDFNYGVFTVGTDDAPGGGHLTTPTQNSGNHSHGMDTVGNDQPHENRPPYYALCFIMKL